MATPYSSAPLIRPKNLHSTSGGLNPGFLRKPNTEELRRLKSTATRWKSSTTGTTAHRAAVVTRVVSTSLHCVMDATVVSGTPEQTHVVPGLADVSTINSRDLMLADVDPTTAKLLIGISGPILSAFGFLFIARIVMSWYPKLPVDKFPYVIAYAPTEPILDATRKLIPPVGGVDVTPVVWFALLSFLNEILLGPQGLLVLLSQQSLIREHQRQLIQI